MRIQSRRTVVVAAIALTGSAGVLASALEQQELAMMSRIRHAAVFAAVALMGSTDAIASAGTEAIGPPAICLPIRCGEKIALPLGEDSRSTVSGYSRDRAVSDAMKALSESKDVLTHMETIRRVTIYLNDDADRCNRLLARLLARAGEAEADGLTEAERGLAWFDAGYFAGALAHIGTDLGWKPGVAQGVQGLAWLERSCEARGNDSAVHFAAAILSHPAMRQSKRDVYERHLKAAVAGAEKGSLLMTNIRSHADHFRESIAALGARD